jgi:hypothetical protein
MCIVTKHHHDREKAKKSLDLQIKKLKRSKDIERDLDLLNKKLNFMLQLESKIATLGTPREIPTSFVEKVSILEKDLKLAQEERDMLRDENTKLKESVDTVTDIKKDIKAHKQKTDTRVHRIEKHIGEHLDRRQRINIMEEKIALLESSYKRISKSKKVSPKRLAAVKEKIKLYKDKLQKLKK